MTRKDEPGEKLIASNRSARRNYAIDDTFEAGVVLMGSEVKGLRDRGATIRDAYAQVRNDEIYLVGLHIPEYFNGTWNNHTPRRRRKLLLHRRELDKILQATRETGHTVIPLSLYFKDGRAKVELAVAKGKKNYAKRQALRERQDHREADRAMSARTRGED